MGLLAIVASSCGGQPLYYTPTAYGDYRGHCYYVNSPQEAQMLIQRNAPGCQGAAPYPMPASWQATYWPYYSSPSYYDTYVPSAYRTVYVQHVHLWQSQNSRLITQDEDRGSWRGSDGSRATGTTVQRYVKTGKASFSGGSGRQQGFSSGSGRSNTTTLHGGFPGGSGRSAGYSYSSSSSSSAARMSHSGFSSGSGRGSSSGFSSHSSFSGGRGR